MKYQDTDSNYVIMTLLETAQTKSKYESMKRYAKSQIFGNYITFFRAFIQNSMNRFPLAFGFEGAFYRVWHIGKKCYTG